MVGKETHQQEFYLLPDPRVIEEGVTIADIKEQEQLALQVVDLLSQAKMEADRVEKELKKMKSEKGDERENLNQLKDALVQSKGRYTQPKLISQISYLYGVINRADQMPGKDAFDRYDELVKELGALID